MEDMLVEDILGGRYVEEEYVEVMICWEINWDKEQIYAKPKICIQNCGNINHFHARTPMAEYCNATNNL